MDLTTIKDVRISIDRDRDFWQGMSFYNSLQPRIFGTIQQWRLQKEFRVDILWDDNAREPLDPAELLPCDILFEPYADNRPAPKPKRRRNAVEGAGSSVSLANIVTATQLSGPQNTRRPQT